MSDYCNYSFDMLYRAAFGKSLTQKKKAKLQSLPQEEINTVVSKWAQKSGWKTEERFDTAGELYLSFFPSVSIQNHQDT